MPEHNEEFISLTLRTRNSKKPLRMLARNWKLRWLLLCLARQATNVSMEWLVAKPTSSNQNLRASWKPVKPQDCVCEIHYQIIMRTILQEKGTIHCNIVIWFTNLCLSLKPKKFQQQRQQWTRNGKNWRKFRRGTWQKSKVRKRWSMKQGRRALQFIFASLMDICHLKNAELEAKHQKYKGRVVLRGDIVKDDSGSYAVFTEQGSSASQMTAAKIMDIISRLPGCAGQEADAVSACTQVKWKMLQNYWKFQIRTVQTFGFVYHETNGQNHGPVWKIQSSLLNEICTVILWQDCYWKVNLRKSYCSTVGRRFPNWECLYSYIVKKGYSYLCMWMTQNWLERNRILIRCGMYSIKKLIWENQHLSSIMYTWDALKDNVK